MNGVESTTGDFRAPANRAPGARPPRSLVAPPNDPCTGEPLRVNCPPNLVRRICASPGRIVFALRCTGDYTNGYRAPLRKGWQTRSEPTVELVDWTERRGWLGLVPASLGLWCVDVDEGGMAAVEAVTEKLGPPLAESTTRRGYHLWYPLADSKIVDNSVWRCGPGKGELRGSNGYVVLWDAPTLLAAIEASVNASPVSPDPLLIDGCESAVNGEGVGQAASARPIVPPSTKLASALRHLNCERMGEVVDYEDWVRIGLAIHHDTGGSEAGFALWDEWSRQFRNYPKAEDQSTAAKWASFGKATRARPITAKTIFRMARSLGWVDPSKRTKREAAIATGAYRRKNATALKSACERMGVEVRYNIRSASPEYRRDGGAWEAADDAYIAALREEVAERFAYVSEHNGEPVPLRFGRDAWYDAVNAIVHLRRVDPFLEWIENLAPWDGTSRLNAWMEFCWRFPDDEGRESKQLPLVRWASEHLCLGSLWMAKKPGSKLDEIVVIVGPPGIGKSTALAHLFPAGHRQEWFSDQFDFRADRKTRTESLLGSVIVEASEMAGSTRAENASIKSFLSGTTDRVRLAFRRDPQVIPRCCILVGTGDHDDILPNDPNLRRFVVVKAEARGTASETAEGVRRFLDANREHLWAEALARYREGETAHLPPELASLQQANAQEHRHRNEGIENAIEELSSGHVREGVTICDLMTKAGLNNSSETVVRKALRSLGWTSRRVRCSGGRRTHWFSVPDQGGQGFR